MKKVQITINGVAADVDRHITVATLASWRAKDRRRVAVAVNAEVVPRSQWAATRLEPGDSIELLVAAAGG